MQKSGGPEEPSRKWADPLISCNLVHVVDTRGRAQAGQGTSSKGFVRGCCRLPGFLLRLSDRGWRHFGRVVPFRAPASCLCADCLRGTVMITLTIRCLQSERPV